MQPKSDVSLSARHFKDRLFHGIFLISTLVAIISLVILLGDLIYKGIGWLDWDFLTNYPSRFPQKAGVKSALAGSIWLFFVTAPLAFIFGVGTAVYLEEYADRSRFKNFIQINIANLAGVPSIVYGILGLALFVRGLNLGRSVLAGGLTMSLLVLPIIVVASQEAIRGVPDSLRHAAFALGANRWQVVRTVVLPTALPGILTGTILALSRVIGETAPLIMIGALSFVAFVPEGLIDQFTVLPIQIFNWTSRPQEEFQNIAAAGILVLLVLLMVMNATAIILRNKFQKRL